MVGVGPKVALIALMSFVVLVAAAKACDDFGSCKKERAWAIACSTVSLVFTGVLLAGWKYGKLAQPLLPGARGELLTSLLLLAWWSAGAGVMTFQSPFTLPSNGYFGSWLAFLAAMNMVSSVLPQLVSAVSSLQQSGSELMYVLFASAVLLAQALTDCCTGYVVWAIIISIFSILMALAGIFAPDKIVGQARMVFTLVLGGLWFSGWMGLTFFGPYRGVGNGYFACCAGLIFSMKLVAQHFGLIQHIESFIGESVPTLGTARPAASAPPASDVETCRAAPTPEEQGYGTVE